MTKQQADELRTIAQTLYTVPTQASVRLKNLISELSIADRLKIGERLYREMGAARRQVRDANDRLNWIPEKGAE